MQVLILNTDDFIFTVECVNIEASYAKAKRKQPNLDTDTSYNWNIPTESIEVYNPEERLEKVVSKGIPANPIFFENKEYVFDVFFKCEIEKPSIFSKSREITEKFYYRKDRKVIAGTLNFGNDIGKSDFILDYFKDGELIRFDFQFEVFPTKLDFKRDYNKILADIENEYPFLVLDYLKQTYTAFKTGSKENSDLIWWQIFGGLFEEFITASEFILNKPNARLLNETHYLKADKLKKINVGIEQELARFRHMPDKLYRVEEKILSIDTVENRFFKHAIFIIATKFERIKKYIEKKYEGNISKSFHEELNKIDKKLKSFKYAQFFKAVGQFKGLQQESLVLQKATGYTTIFKDWIMLNRGIDFLDGVQKLELKNIADLYQIWCFLEMKSLLKEILGKDPDEVKLAKLQIDDFVFKIRTGARSKVSFKTENGEIIDLYHEFHYGKNSNNLNRSFTVNQTPDIVLKMSKNDLRDNFYFTYLYDAKYRLQSDDDPKKPDIPPNDAINQMHRYRDAIYYKSSTKIRPEKEVIGGYILFPGDGTHESIRNNDFFRSIADVNIGAYPLKPNDDKNKIFLKEHLQEIIGLDTELLLNEVSPQKDSKYESPNPYVLIGFVPSEIHVQCFEDAKDPFYYTGVKKPTRFGYNNLKYFAPYIKGKGIKDYYEIIDYKIVERSKIFLRNNPLYKNEPSERLMINLGAKKHQIGYGKYFKISDGSIGQTAPYRYTKLKNIRTPKNEKIEVLKVSK